MITMIALASAVVASAVSADTVRQRHSAHDRAVAAVQELVASVFDVQLRRLEVNGLQASPTYVEIARARSNSDQLVARDMRQLTDLFGQAEKLQGDEQAEVVRQTRAVARHIAVKLLAERRRVQKRLQISRVELLLRKMIRVEEQAISKARAWGDAPASKRRSKADQLVDQQLDLVVVNEEMISVLDELLATPGQQAFVARNVRKFLASQQLEEQLQQAAEQLDQLAAEAAMEHERAALAMLQQTLKVLQRSQQISAADREAAMQTVAAIRQQQQQVREKATASDLTTAPQRDALADEQHQVATALEKAQAMLSELFQLDEPSRAAVAAARQAEQNLKQGEQEPALQRQDDVLRRLAEMTETLKLALPDANTAERTRDLEALGQSLDSALETQADATAAAAKTPEQAKQLEDAVAAALKDADEMNDVGDVIESQLDQTQDLVREAQDALQDATAAAEQDRLQAAKSAEQSLLETAAEIESQLSEMRQSQQATPNSNPTAAANGSSNSQPSSGTTRDAGSSSVSGSPQDIAARGFADEPWFARLPPALRARLQTRTRRPAPRGYEEQLQRYFQSTD